MAGERRRLGPKQEMIEPPDVGWAQKDTGGWGHVMEIIHAADRTSATRLP